MILSAWLVAGASHAQTISTISGNGSHAWTGDGGPATSAGHARPVGIARDAAGNLYVAEETSNRIRKIAPNGVISTFAGNGLETNTGIGSESNVGDGGPATSAPMAPRQLAIDAGGNLYVADIAHQRVRKITPAGTISTVAGSGLIGFSGDGGPATSARFQVIKGLAVDNAGNLYISVGERVRKVNTSGTISTIAGTGAWGYSGDGGPATSATLRTPGGLAVDSLGNVYFAEIDNNVVRRISNSGTISTAIGGGIFFDDLLGKKLKLDRPTDVAIDSKGYIYVVLENSDAVRKMSPLGAIGNAGGYFCPYQRTCPYNAFIGDGGDALQATLNRPTAIELDAADNLYIADSQNMRIRRVTPSPPVPDPIATDAFAPRTKKAIDSFPEAVAIGDFTGDGRNDIAVATREWISFDPRPDDFKIFLYTQLPDGSLAEPVKAAYGTTNATHVGLLLVDLNHDGRKDIVLGHGEGLVVFAGNAAGTLAPVQIPMPNDHAYLYYSPIVAMDVNRDGHLDIVEVGTNPATSQGGFWTHRGDGNLGFAAPTFTETPPAVRRQMVTGDMDGDGNLDLVTIGSRPGNYGIELLAHDGVAGFGRGRSLFGYRMQAFEGLSTGDVNDDGRTDVALAQSDNSPTWVRLFTQDTHGQLDGPFPLQAYDGGMQTAMADINGDGRTDLLVLHSGWAALSYYQRLAKGFAPAAKFELPTDTNRYDNPGSFAVGDVNSDGCLDVVVADETDDLVILPGLHCQASAAVSDFDGDRKSDLLWLGAGAAQVWPGVNQSESTHLAAAAGWRVAAVGDFTGDGSADLFWRNCVNGASRVWNGGRESQSRPAASLSDKAWSVAASGDFDGDGVSDLLWRHVGGHVMLWPAADAWRQRRMATMPVGWSVATVGDFDGDGRDDVFWRHAPSGANLIWRAGGAAGARRATAILDRAWRAVGAGDFDGDGKSDVLWRNSGTGANTIWRSAEFSTQLSLRGVTDLAWSVAAVGDFDGDRRFDIAWHHAGTGSNVVWKRADSTNTQPFARTPPNLQPSAQPNSCWGSSRAAGAATRIEARAPASRTGSRRW